jgi:FMN phosphatase YigB (HAD superfamily)
LPSELWQLIQQHDIVSFDVFDTLLIRRVAQPTDVFELVGRRAGVPRYRRLRIAAEARARERKRETTGHPEVDLEEIFRELRKDVHHRTQELMAAELAMERLVLRPNPAVRAMFDAASAAGATIVATSDSYFTADFIEQCLVEAGWPVSRVLVSGEIGKSKHKGDLFAHLADCMSVRPGRILHIGDNLQSDFKSALKAGCSAWHCVSNCDRLFRDARYNQPAISGLVAAEDNPFASLVVGHAATCNAAIPELNGAELFGRMYAGPMLLAFAQWVEHLRKIEGVKRLFLLTRDGYVLDEALRIIGSSAECAVVHSSRRMSYMAVLEQEFESTCLHIASSGLGATVREVVLGLQVAQERALLHALDAMIDLDDEILSLRDIERFAAALRQCREVLVTIAREECDALVDYLKPLRLTEPDAALVDCGWALSTHRRLEMLAGGPIRGYYVGSVDHAHHHDKIRTFLFERGVPSPWKAIHLDAVELLELPFITLQRQTVRMARERGVIEPVFSTADAATEGVRHVYAAAIQREALAFCRSTVDLAASVRTTETAEALLILFESLTRMPTSFEYFSLATVPHARALGAHELTTIETYWRCCFNPNPTSSLPVRRGLSHYLRLGLLSLRRDGLITTLYRSRRKLRIWLFSPIAALFNRWSGAAELTKRPMAMPNTAHATTPIDRSIGVV